MAKKSGASKTDTVVKLALVFFISLLSFTLGTYVGKQVSDSEYQTAKYDAEDYKQFRKEASLENHEEEPNNSGLSEEEIKSLTEEFVNNDGRAEREIASKHKGNDHNGHDSHEEKQHKDGYAQMSKIKHHDKSSHKNEHEKDEHTSKNKNHKKDKAAHHSTSKEAGRVAAGLSPTSDPKPQRKQASAFPKVATSTIGKFTVQVASYATENEAEDRATKLKNKGFEAFYISAMIKGKKWYRVSVGLFDSHKSANDFKATLMKQAQLKSAFVQKIIK